MSAPKILMVAGDAAESLEVLYPYQRLQEEGYEVQIAAPSKKKLHFVVHDFEPGYDTYTEKPGYSWDADLAFKDVKPDDYVALVIPGGRAPEYIRNDPDLQKIIRHFFQQEKPVAQLCHAPLALAAAGVLKGRKSAAYPALAPDVAAAGAEFVDSGAPDLDARLHPALEAEGTGSGARAGGDSLIGTDFGLGPASRLTSIPASDLGGLLHRRDRLECRLARFKESADQRIELLAFLEDQLARLFALLRRQLAGLQQLCVAVDDRQWRAQVMTQQSQFLGLSPRARNHHGRFLHRIALPGRYDLSIVTFALLRAEPFSL